MLIDTSDLLQDTHIEKVIFKYPDMRLLSEHFNISLGERNLRKFSFSGLMVCTFPQLACRLPARVQGYPWRLAYSTEKHGTSLKTLYRNLADVDSPVLLAIKDMDNQVDIVIIDVKCLNNCEL